MNKAILDTNVTQNLALSPSTWLMPSNMVILKKKNLGYNNVLKTATKSMRFRVNNGMNYYRPKVGQKPKPEVHKKKVHVDGGEHLETLDDTTPAKTKTRTSAPTAAPMTYSGTVTTAVITSVVGFLVRGYIF